MSANSKTPRSSRGKNLSPLLNALIWLAQCNPMSRYRYLPWPMHQIKVQIWNTHVCQRLVKGRLYILWRMLAVPELAGNEDVFPWDSRLSDSLANFSLILVDGCAVKVAISLFQCNFDSTLDLMWRRLPCTETNSRDLGTCVECKVRGKVRCSVRHGGCWYVGCVKKKQVNNKSGATALYTCDPSMGQYPLAITYYCISDQWRRHERKTCWMRSDFSTIRSFSDKVHSDPRQTSKRVRGSFESLTDLRSCPLFKSAHPLRADFGKITEQHELER